MLPAWGSVRLRVASTRHAVCKKQQSPVLLHVLLCSREGVGRGMHAVIRAEQAHGCSRGA